MVEFILRRNERDKKTWCTAWVKGFRIQSVYFENKDMFDAHLYDSSKGKSTQIVYSIFNASSLEDICLQFEHNKNPLHEVNWGDLDGFCVDYERSSPSEIAATIADKLEVCSNTFKKLSNDLNQDSITLPKVHVPKKFKTFQFN